MVESASDPAPPPPALVIVEKILLAPLVPLDPVEVEPLPPPPTVIVKFVDFAMPVKVEVR
jgi:hypothetical protein